MKYLLDTNSFVTPNKTYYNMQRCPQFWKWILDMNRNGILFSIQKVKQELMNYEDELKEWVSQQDDNFFLPFDEECLKAFFKVTAAVNENKFYSEAHRAIFYDGADPYLISHALAHGFTIITFEKSAGDPRTKKVKIPDVCKSLTVGCTDLWGLFEIHPFKP
jgi:hypothetical protein